MPRYIDAKQIRYSWMIDADGKEHDGVTLQSIIDKVPTADVVEVKHGKWIRYGINSKSCTCSNCNITQTVNIYNDKVMFNYCPYCGAKMKRSDDKNE